MSRSGARGGWRWSVFVAAIVVVVLAVAAGYAAMEVDLSDRDDTAIVQHAPMDATAAAGEPRPS